MDILWINVKCCLSSSADGANNLDVAVSDGPVDKITSQVIAQLKSFGNYEGDVDADTKIKIKPEKAVNGNHVVILYEGDGTIAFAEVKVYVRPTKKVPGPGEPEGPGGPDGPDGPEVRYFNAMQFIFFLSNG